MANPSRIPDPRYDDPVNPIPTPGADPLFTNRRPDPANSDNPAAIDNRTVVQSRGSGTGVLIAAVVLVLALAAYLLFAPAGTPTVAPTPDQPVTTGEPVQPAPDAMAPAAPADPAQPAPESTAPAAPADPAQPAPQQSAPANPPAEPAPAPAPAPAQ